MTSERGQFSSRIGFIMAATGSAVGLGNVWGFPTQTANNGGAAFVLVYLLLSFLVAYPALMAELILGRHARSNIVTALSDISVSAPLRLFAKTAGGYAVLIASLILSFYAIVAGWMLAHMLHALCELVGWHDASVWLSSQSISRNLVFTGIFSGLTAAIVAGGVADGIEKWSSRLMPALMILLLCLIAYVLTQDGALTGLKHYLLPDLSRVSDPSLMINAMGQAFFSLSLGVGTMLIYGSYLSKSENLPRMGAIVTLVDVGIAFTAGLLIIPAIYVAQHNGVEVFSAEGKLIAGPDLIFQVLPSLFNTMGMIGAVVSFGLFTLLSIAALTSSISMLEVPVSLAAERTRCSRSRASLLVAALIFVFSSVIILNFASLFGLVIDITTKYSEPLMGVVLCIFAGWVLRRDQLLEELKKGQPNIEHSLFWKIWPLYVRVFCPALILLTFYHSVF